MKKNDIYNVNIKSVGSNGEGVCRVDNMAVFVPFAVLGDEAEIKIVKVNKNYAFGRLERVLTPSPSRVSPKCTSFGKCGGCALQTTDYKSQLEIKRQKVKDALERIGGFTDADVAQCFGSDPFYEYRNKAQYPVADVGGKAETGFYAPRSHRLVKMDDCALTDSDSKIILNTVIDFLRENKIRAYDEETKKGTVRHVYTRHGDNEIIAVIVSASKSIKDEEKLVEKLLSAPLKRKLSGIVYNYNPLPNNVILGDTHKILYGKSYIHDTLCGIDFKIDYKSFYQVNKKTTENLYAKAIELLAPSPSDTVLDLYCGIGTITLCAAKHCGKVIGVEVVEEAILDARENALTNGITNAEFYVGTAEEVCPKLVENGLTASAVIVDPPRKGCDSVLLDTLLKLAPSRIVYVSCDPATLARDAKFLCENGYTLGTAYPFDQFPQTGHVETVVCLSREKADESEKESNMISDEINKYKSWGKLKKQMNALICDSLKDRVTYFYTRYHKDRGSFGRATINLDKSELIAFSWDIGIDIQWNDEYKACLENHNEDQETIHNKLMNEKWMQQGTLCHHDFLEAVTTYLKIDITSSLNSDNYILRVFAYMDRRVGKRTLVKIQDEVEKLPDWVKQFYQIRCEADGIVFPPKRITDETVVRLRRN